MPTSSSGNPCSSSYSEADRERVRANLDLCLESLGQSNTWEVQKVRKDGETLWVRETATAIERAKGGVVVLDCRRRHHRAQARGRVGPGKREALSGPDRARLRCGVAVGRQYRHRYASPSTERILGYSPENWSAATASTLSIPISFETPRSNLRQQAADPGSVYRSERLIRHKLGEWLWTENTVTNLLGEPSVRAFVVNLRDITQRRQAEEALRASEERFRTFVDYATDGFFLFDERQAILDVNRQACDGLGYGRQEMLGMHPRDFDAGLDAASIATIGARVGSGETVTFETLHRRKDGTVFPVEVRARQFQQGAHRFRLSLVRDITVRKRVDEALRRSESYLAEAQRLSHTGTIVFSATGPVVLV